MLIFSEVEKKTENVNRPIFHLNIAYFKYVT